MKRAYSEGLVGLPGLVEAMNANARSHPRILNLHGHPHVIGTTLAAPSPAAPVLALPESDPTASLLAMGYPASPSFVLPGAVSATTPAAMVATLNGKMSPDLSSLPMYFLPKAMPPLLATNKRRRISLEESCSIATQELQTLQQLQSIKIQQLQELRLQQQQEVSKHSRSLLLASAQLQASSNHLKQQQQLQQRQQQQLQQQQEKERTSPVLSRKILDLQEPPKQGPPKKESSVKVSPGCGAIPKCEQSGTRERSKRNIKFRDYQEEIWTDKLKELMEFKKQRGHCNVPHSYEENPGLAQWVKRQRYQHKLKMDGKKSTLTNERLHILKSVGFIWNSHDAVWEERYNELIVYREYYRDCIVPSTYKANQPLAVWVKRQRRQFKLLQQGKPSSLTPTRIAKLNRLEFSWDCRKERDLASIILTSSPGPTRAAVSDDSTTGDSQQQPKPDTATTHMLSPSSSQHTLQQDIPTTTETHKNHRPSATIVQQERSLVATLLSNKKRHLGAIFSPDQC